MLFCRWYLIKSKGNDLDGKKKHNRLGATKNSCYINKWNAWSRIRLFYDVMQNACNIKSEKQQNTIALHCAVRFSHFSIVCVRSDCTAHWCRLLLLSNVMWHVIVIRPILSPFNKINKNICILSAVYQPLVYRDTNIS